MPWSKGQEKNNKLNFLWPKTAHLGPRFWPPHKLFSGGPNWGFWVGAKKFMLKEFMCFFRPHTLWRCFRLGVQKLTRSGLNEVSERDVWKTNWPFFEASQNPIPKRRKLLAKRPFLEAKRAVFQNPFKLDRVRVSTPDLQFYRQGGYPKTGILFRHSLRGSLLKKRGVTTIACTYLWRFLLLPTPPPWPPFSSLATQAPPPYPPAPPPTPLHLPLPPCTSPYPGPPIRTHKQMRQLPPAQTTP